MSDINKLMAFDDEETPVTLFDDQQRRVLALNAARDVLAAKTIMTSGGVMSDELIKVAEYIIGDEAVDRGASIRIGGVVTSNVQEAQQFLDDRKPRCNMPHPSQPNRACNLPDDHTHEHSDGNITWSWNDEDFL
ncbi:hypothetical protein PBI_LAUER_59 [Gordonia phage Lauer]|uniref:Uncharacterized protein n=1 Tax=Gordonia phage Lauer TaxID=2656538 RepID=A0A649VIG7_9CAUD|nr:hypothetical protein PP995_gp59 [Gordonia phage Lauer]QGJ92166.1 hypothetical protein PBI_LAUER_59 [Gordonia phage Lauer]